MTYGINFSRRFPKHRKPQRGVRGVVANLPQTFNEFGVSKDLSKISWANLCHDNMAAIANLSPLVAGTSALIDSDGVEWSLNLSVRRPIG